MPASTSAAITDYGTYLQDTTAILHCLKPTETNE
jgi:hypothetical protein